MFARYTCIEAKSKNMNGDVVNMNLQETSSLGLSTYIPCPQSALLTRSRNRSDATERTGTLESPDYASHQ